MEIIKLILHRLICFAELTEQFQVCSLCKTRKSIKKSDQNLPYIEGRMELSSIHLAVTLLRGLNLATSWRS